MRILVLGASGMLGYSIFANLSDQPGYNVFGTLRALKKDDYFNRYRENLIEGVDVNDFNTVLSVIGRIKPDAVINCIGLIKQLDISRLQVPTIYINSLLPHRLADACDGIGARLIHFSTDCVFSGEVGSYTETDRPDSIDLYGRSKALGEVNSLNHLTLRTSIIGHELYTSNSLVDWFLSQNQGVKGFDRAIFSGLPTVFIAKVLAEKILPKYDLGGLYNLSVAPISKYELLQLVAKSYGKEISIDRDVDFVIDRSLDSSALSREIGEFKLPWDQLINLMHSDYIKRYKM